MTKTQTIIGALPLIALFAIVGYIAFGFAAAMLLSPAGPFMLAVVCAGALVQRGGW